jgi:hypothetical protein
VDITSKAFVASVVVKAYGFVPETASVRTIGCTHIITLYQSKDSDVSLRIAHEEYVVWPKCLDIDSEETVHDVLFSQTVGIYLSFSGFNPVPAELSTSAYQIPVLNCRIVDDLPILAQSFVS